jgi:hypothetical protein
VITRLLALSTLRRLSMVWSTSGWKDAMAARASMYLSGMRRVTKVSMSGVGVGAATVSMADSLASRTGTILIEPPGPITVVNPFTFSTDSKTA